MNFDVACRLPLRTVWFDSSARKLLYSPDGAISQFCSTKAVVFSVHHPMNNYAKSITKTCLLPEAKLLFNVCELLFVKHSVDYFLYFYGCIV
jgi:hypothetical protein